MVGEVSWPQLIFVCVVILGAASGTWVVIWKVWEVVSKERQASELRFGLVTERFNIEKEMIEKRIADIEIFNAGLNMTMKLLDEFRGDVREDFAKLRQERRDDMHKLHERLDRIITEKRVNGSR